jgi:hypothetical protein
MNQTTARRLGAFQHSRTAELLVFFILLFNSYSLSRGSWPSSTNSSIAFFPLSRLTIDTVDSNAASEILEDTFTGALIAIARDLSLNRVVTVDVLRTFGVVPEGQQEDVLYAMHRVLDRIRTDLRDAADSEVADVKVLLSANDCTIPHVL